MATVDYLTDDEISEYMRFIKTDFVLADLPAYIRGAAFAEINKRADQLFEVSADTLYVDGQRTQAVLCPKIPIVTLTGVTTIAEDETETSLDLSGSDRQVIYDPNTGYITLLKNVFSRIELGLDNQDGYPVFPEGTRNIKIEGTFGQIYSDLVKFLELLIITRNMKLRDPAGFNKFDIIKEKIGKYSYELSDFSRSRSDNKDSLEDYIDHMFTLLPKADTMALEAI